MATASTPIYTLSLHDALPIFSAMHGHIIQFNGRKDLGQALPEKIKLLFLHRQFAPQSGGILDRKSTRLNSSHTVISYAVFCLKKKKAAARHGRDGHALACAAR